MLGKLSRMKTKPHSNYAVAACLVDLGGKVPTEIQLTLDGTFKAKDGRPEKLTGWVVNAEIAASVIAVANELDDEFCIDYNHQTLYAEKNGQDAPAAGWFKTLEYREGVGIFATDVQWTKEAALKIQEKEYRYISPVFLFDSKTGAVEKIIMAALVNVPALDGMKDLAALASQHFSQTTKTTEALSMDLDELLSRLRYLFNLPTLATAEEITAQLDRAKEILTSGQTETAAASISILDLIAKKDGQIAALSMQTPDPTKFVPVTTMAKLQSELATIQAEWMEEKTHRLVEVALSDGRLLPTQKEWAIEAGKKDFVWLSARIEATPKNLALLGTQTGGKSPEGDDKKGEGSATEVASRATAYQAQQAALGFQIDDIAAINHVMSEWVKNV